MIKTIRRMGNPILRKTASKVAPELFNSPQLNQLIIDLEDSMRHYEGIGIAAPQIGEDYQVAIIELSEVNRYDEKIDLPFTVFINPEIEVLTSKSQGYWEGCLSVPGIRGYVERPEKIKVSFQNFEGEKQEMIAEGFIATVIQHELDHLKGVLYIDHVKDPGLLSFQEEYEEFQQGQA